MPEIPVPQARLLDHTRAAGPLSQHGQLRYYDNGNAQALSAAGKMFDKGISALAEFQRKSEETENRLSATEAQNLYTKLNADLEQRMAKNPGAFDKFESWAKETDKAFEEGVKPFLDRMTPEFRKQFAADMDGLRIRTTHQRMRTGIHAKVTADYNRFQTLFLEAADNNHEEAVRLLNQHRGTLISEEEFKTKLEIDLPRISETAEARRLIDANAEGIISFLDDKNKEGEFTNFSHIPDAKRRELLNYARAKDSRRRMEENLVMLDQLNSGKVFTKADIETAFEGKTSAEDLRQKHDQIQMIDRFESSRKKQLKIYERTKKAKILDAEEFRILTFRFSANPNEAQQQYNDLKNKIIVSHAGDGPAVKRLFTQLDDTFQSQSRTEDGTSYKKSYIYIRAQSMIDEMKDQFYSRYPGRGERWYSFMTNVYNNSDDLELNNFNMAKIRLDHFIKKNPNASEGDVRIFLDQLKKDVNNAECDKLVEFWRTRSTPSTTPPLSYNKNQERIGVDKNGRKWVVVGNKVIREAK